MQLNVTVGNHGGPRCHNMISNFRSMTFAACKYQWSLYHHRFSILWTCHIQMLALLLPAGLIWSRFFGVSGNGELSDWSLTLISHVAQSEKNNLEKMRVLYRLQSQMPRTLSMPGFFAPASTTSRQFFWASKSHGLIIGLLVRSLTTILTFVISSQQLSPGLCWSGLYVHNNGFDFGPGPFSSQVHHPENQMIPGSSYMTINVWMWDETDWWVYGVCLVFLLHLVADISSTQQSFADSQYWYIGTVTDIDFV